MDSLLAQSYTDFELIISDNASTDQTEAICREYAARDPRVRYYRSEQDVGLANNFNYLFMRARGEYFKWAAADDVHEPDWIWPAAWTCWSTTLRSCWLTGRRDLSTRTEVRSTIPIPVSTCDSDATSDRLRYVISATSWVNAIFGLIRTKTLAKTRLFPNYPGGDYPLLAELAVLGKFVEVPDLLFRRRLHPAASSQNTGNAEYLMRLWTASGHKTLPVWNRSKDDFKTIRRSGLSAGEKLSLELSLLRVMVTARRRLLAELKAGLFS